MNKKVKKFISKGLVWGLILSNISTASFAGVLSDDTRYEIFEGFNISINNILDNHDATVEIEGDTIVNLLRKEGSFKNVNDYVDRGGKNITCENNELKFNVSAAVGADGKVVIQRKENTYYTIVYTTKVSNSTTQSYIRVLTGEGRTIVKTSNANNKTNFTTYKLLLSPSELQNYKEFYLYYRGTVTSGSGDVYFKNVMVLEGDWTNKEVPQYFEGMKSVGQNSSNSNQIELLSRNKNLFEDNVINQTGTGNSANGQYYPTMFHDSATRCRSANFINVKPNTTYYLSSGNKFSFVIIEFDEENRQICDSDWIIPVQGGKYTTSENCKKIIVLVKKVDNSTITPQEVYGNVQIEEGSTATEYVGNNSSVKKINLKEPLRSLPSGLRDRIVKKDGQWFIERKCGEMIADGTGYLSVHDNTSSSAYMRFRIGLPQDAKNSGSNSLARAEYKVDNVNMIDSIPPVEGSPSKESGFYSGSAYIGGNPTCYLSIDRTKLSTQNVAGFSEWLKENNITIVYELKNPIYEPLNNNLVVNLYKGITHISNNSIIPLNMKITADRVANRAKECSETAKLSPTVENLSIARMWINLMKDSTLKDQFQNIINDISQLEDLELEKKKVSSSMDLYVKSLNMLSMSLSTNAVTFENYSGIEDMEMLGAVDIIVNSSLPYDLNAYAPSEIYNSDKSKMIDIRTLNIRDNSKSSYQQFPAVNNKVVLKENCQADNGAVHTIDLKLSNDDAHKADVYKTVIKFEVQQR